MVETARLESVYTGNRIGGSNPSLSAINPKLDFLDCLKAVTARSPGQRELLASQAPGGIWNGHKDRESTMRSPAFL